MHILTGPTSYETARRKARYGHRPWTVWVDKQGNRFAAPECAESIKMALLAVGTQGMFTSGYENGHGSLYHWRSGINLMQWHQKGNFAYVQACR